MVDEDDPRGVGPDLRARFRRRMVGLVVIVVAIGIAFVLSMVIAGR
ncbi:MAG: hypothetical protein ACRDYD_09645 [Acidimicrobiales bacterium]